MYEELGEAIKAFLSNNPEFLKAAENFLINLIENDPKAYLGLFYFYNNSTEIVVKQFTLTLLTRFTKVNFDSVLKNLSEFSIKLSQIVMTNTDNEFFKLQEGIVTNVAAFCPDVWRDFQSYLTLYQQHDHLLPFCIFLLDSSYYNRNVYPKYKELLESHELEISLRGLQYESVDVQLITIGFITERISEREDESVFNAYQKHYQLIGHIAENSSDKPPDYFNMLWSKFFNLRPKYLHPFFDLAIHFLAEKELSEDSIMKLLQIIIRDYERINQEQMELIINKYFEAQVVLAENENNKIFFEILSTKYFKVSYELFKKNLLIFLHSNNYSYVRIVNAMLRHFLMTYNEQINGDISDFIDILIENSKKSPECMLDMLFCFNYYIKINKFNIKDTLKLYEFFLSCFTIKDNFDYQFRALQMSNKMGPNPVCFDIFVSNYENIQYEALPIYFSFLTNLHSVENNISDEKYEPFIQFLLTTFDKSLNTFNELNNTYQEDQSNEEVESELYNYALLHHSAANLVFLLSIFYPIRFSDYKLKAIQSFIFLLNEDLENLREYDDDMNYNLRCIKNDFALVFKKDINGSIEFLRNSYEIIINDSFVDNLLHILCEMEGEDFILKTSFISYFEDLLKTLFPNPKTVQQKNTINGDAEDYYNSVEHLTYLTEVDLLPMLNWLYKLKNLKIHQAYFKSIMKLLTRSSESYELTNFLFNIIKKLVKPGNVNNNQGNAVYSAFITKLIGLMQFFAENKLPKLSPSIYFNIFKGLTDLMKFFMYTKSEYCHEFLFKFILQFYSELPESSEKELIKLFIKMIDINCYSEEELNKMLEIIRLIKERPSIFYNDSRPALFILITKLTKISSELIPEFYEFVVNTFNEVKDNPYLLNVKASCSYFLLSTFNQNPSQEQADLINPLIPDIFSVFPCKKLINKIFIEIKGFIEHIKGSFKNDSSTKNILSVILSAFVRYLSYQINAKSIFNFDETFNNELHEMFNQLLIFYRQTFQIENVEELLNSLFPGHPIAIQYIFSLHQ